MDKIVLKLLFPWQVIIIHVNIPIIQRTSEKENLIKFDSSSTRLSRIQTSYKYYLIKKDNSKASRLDKICFPHFQHLFTSMYTCLTSILLRELPGAACRGSATSRPTVIFSVPMAATIHKRLCPSSRQTTIHKEKSKILSCVFQLPDSLDKKLPPTHHPATALSQS